MAITKPYRRIHRQLIDGCYSSSGNGGYVSDPRYAKNPDQYTRAFTLIQKDLITLFEYIEPSDQNLKTYSYRTHELLMRACIEFEANCKAILIENGYIKDVDNMSVVDYNKLEQSHYLSKYKVKIPYWKGDNNIVMPFKDWGEDKPLSWYQVYNKTKHNRSELFHEATFENMLNAICGLLVILTAQFGAEDFISFGGIGVEWSSPNPFDSALGEYFGIEYPKDLALDNRYDFTWDNIKDEGDPFNNFDYK